MEEWEELLHPGPQAAFYPTLPHDATPIPHFPPPTDVRRVCVGPDLALLVGFRRWVTVGESGAAEVHAVVQFGRRNAACGFRAVPSVGCAPSGASWEESGGRVRAAPRAGRARASLPPRERAPPAAPPVAVRRLALAAAPCGAAPRRASRRGSSLGARVLAAWRVWGCPPARGCGDGRRIRRMTSSLLPRRRKRAALAVLAAIAAAVPVAGCGDSSGSSGGGGNAGADPAAFLPASAPVYVELQVRPSGDLAANAKTVAGKVLRTSDPAGRSSAGSTTRSATRARRTRRTSRRGSGSAPGWR